MRIKRIVLMPILILCMILFHLDTIKASHNWNDNGFVCNSGGNTFTFTTLTNNGDSTLLKIRGEINRNILIDAGNYGANVGAILKKKVLQN